MHFNKQIPPRKFKVGFNQSILIKDCGSIKLDADEQVTFLTSKSAEYDVVRKSWGFYATPSINGRLKNFGLKTALVKNKFDKYYVMIVEMGSEEDFFNYLKEESNEIITWLDSPESINLNNFKNKDV
tara:strand:- start:18 stop:398 length:381 start_codon:yes stop_codon:yes gene_type:complete